MNAIAVFKDMEGDVIVSNYKNGVKIKAHFTNLPPGKHGFHIHKAGDLRGEGCMGLCEHYDIGHNSHGSPGYGHTGDLGNIESKNGVFNKEYFIKGITVKDLWGRSVIIHEDEDDLEQEKRIDLMKKIFEKNNLVFKKDFMDIYAEWEKPYGNRYVKMSAFVDMLKRAFK